VDLSQNINELGSFTARAFVRIRPENTGPFFTGCLPLLHPIWGGQSACFSLLSNLRLLGQDDLPLDVLLYVPREASPGCRPHREHVACSKWDKRWPGPQL